MNSLKIKQRQSNIELLRIISMFFILSHHFVLWGVNDFASNDLLTPFNKVLFAILYTPGKLGVALFILITGYFMVESVPKIKHILYLYFQMWFYSMLFLGIAFVVMHSVNLGIVMRSVFPFIHHSYWFITAYIILYILIPFINQGIRFIYNKHYENYIFILLTILFLFIHTEIWDFIYLYCLGGFIKKGVFPLNKMKLKYCLSGIVILFIWLIYYVVIKVYATMPVDFEATMHKISVLHSPFVLLSAICMFNIFKNLDFGTKRGINSISKNVLGVYLIHENIIFRPILWKHVFLILNKINPVFCPLISYATIFVLFCIFVLTDKFLSRCYRFILGKLN